MHTDNVVKPQDFAKLEASIPGGSCELLKPGFILVTILVTKATVAFLVHLPGPMKGPDKWMLGLTLC